MKLATQPSFTAPVILTTQRSHQPPRQRHAWHPMAKLVIPGPAHAVEESCKSNELTPTKLKLGIQKYDTLLQQNPGKSAFTPISKARRAANNASETNWSTIECKVLSASDAESKAKDTKPSPARPTMHIQESPRLALEPVQQPSKDSANTPEHNKDSSGRF